MSVGGKEVMAIHEECGVFGVMSTKREKIAELVYYGLYALQHRGQESCGIVVNDRTLTAFRLLCCIGSWL